MKSYGVVGGGISGLSFCYYLLSRARTADIKVTMIEKGSRVGGWMHSKTVFGDTSHPYILEKGPRSIRLPGGDKTLELVHELGLFEKQVIAGSEHVSGKRYLYFDGKMQELPSSLRGMLGSSIGRSLLCSVIQEPFHRKQSIDDESVYNFFERRFGKYVADYLIKSLILGIYAGDARELSLRTVFPSMKQHEEKHGSVVFGMIKQMAQTKQALPEVHKDILSYKAYGAIKKSQIFSFRDGIETLPKTLLQALEKDERFCLHLESRVDHVRMDGNDKITASWHETAAGGTVHNAVFDHLVLSCPSFEAAEILHELAPKSAQGLGSIEHADVAVINVMMDKRSSSTQNIPIGFGYLVPPSEKENVLGVIFDSQTFPEQDIDSQFERLTIMMGGAKSLRSTIDFSQNTAQDISKIAISALERHLNICTKDIVLVDPSLHRNAIPQPKVGHTVLQNGIVTNLPGSLSILSNAIHGVSLNDCIKSGAVAATNLLQSS